MSENARSVGDVVKEIVLPEQEYKCPIHGEYKGIPIFWKPLGKSFDPQCPKCEEEMAIKEAEEKFQTDADKAKEARDEEEIMRLDRLAEMNIGEKFWNEDFDTFNPYTDELKRNLEKCVVFTEHHQGRMLVMLGNNGNGKDHLAASILKRTGGYIYTVFEIELMLQECYADKSKNQMDIYKRLWKAPLLVINEIGRHKVENEWTLNFLSNIVDKRYQNFMPTILVSNYHLFDDCPEKGCKKCLQNYLGDDILSRIIESGEIIHFTGEDYRYKKRVDYA
jgi:DNA replication protein DnaC